MYILIRIVHGSFLFFLDGTNETNIRHSPTLTQVETLKR